MFFEVTLDRMVSQTVSLVIEAESEQEIEKDLQDCCGNIEYFLERNEDRWKLRDVEMGPDIDVIQPDTTCGGTDISFMDDQNASEERQLLNKFYELPGDERKKVMELLGGDWTALIARKELQANCV